MKITNSNARIARIITLEYYKNGGQHGQIDILTVDDAGDFVLFELKRALSPDDAIGQLTRYMGWVQQRIGKDRKVRGVIVAKTISESLRYAMSVIPNVSLFEYEVSVKLNSVAKI